MFISPTVIHFQGDAAVDGKRDIYLSAGIQKHLRKVYDYIRQRDSSLSREKFANFLIHGQGETAPKLDKENYKFEEFLEVWWLTFGLEAMRPVPIADKDLTKPISNYFISSSHNTYLPGNQLSGKSSAAEYRKVLRRGCRCVEIDVWDGDSPGSSPDRTIKARQKPDHHTRHLSGSSLHSAAATLMGTVEDKIEQARLMMGEKRSQSRSPSFTQQDLTAPAFGRDSSGNLDPAATTDRPEDHHSRSRSRHSFRRNEPIVMHGYTLTSPVGFREVCIAVRESAFETSNLPIIVSLEVHADFEQQQVMVDIMKEEWDGLLVDKPNDGCPAGRMPRLEELLNKILIKVKKASPKPDAQAAMASLAPTSTHDDECSGSDDERSGGTSSIKKAKTLICDNLSALAIYTHSEHFKNFQSHAAKIPSHIFSISESRILELYTTKHKEMFQHNRHFFMRAFPKGSRFDSSNPDPSLFWRKGVQMVALNWQSWDEGMMLNEGMFAGEQGWVLKPQGYLSDDTPTLSTNTISHRTLDMRIVVLAGQHIPLPEGASKSGMSNTKAFRPFVKCELHIEKQEERPGASAEGSTRTFNRKQQTSPGKTDHPDFGGHKNMFEFIGIPNVVDQLSFVR
jgi:phosphatidylinositol phospholipase C delta